MRALAVFFVALLAAPACLAQSIQVGVVAVDSVEDFQRWLGKPADPSKAAAPGAYPRGLTQLPFGRKTQLPIVLTGWPVPVPQALQYAADVEILGSDGRSIGSSPACCVATIRRGSLERAVVLMPVLSVEPDAANRKGSYTVRVKVTDGARTWNASVALPYGESADLPGVASEAPRLRMNVPPERPEGGGPGDKRDCLSMPTPSEVIRCSERK